jgi:hypothetical protein
MKARSLGLLVVAALTLALRAEEKPVPLDATVSKVPLDWNDPKWWEIQSQKTRGISLGKSDYVLRGPLLETFRRPARPVGERGWARKFFDLPVVNLLVPQPMPTAGGGQGRYLAWGENDAPWSAVSTRSRGGSSSGLLGVSW